LNIIISLSLYPVPLANLLSDVPLQGSDIISPALYKEIYSQQDPRDIRRMNIYCCPFLGWKEAKIYLLIKNNRLYPAKLFFLTIRKLGVLKVDGTGSTCKKALNINPRRRDYEERASKRRGNTPIMSGL